jgi:hypothetical protein
MKVMPRGRMTIRPSANALEPVDGRVNRRIKFWEFPEAEAGSILAKVESVYFGALESVDSTHSARELAAKNPDLSPTGVKTENYKLSLANVAKKKGRDNVLAKAREEAAARREKLKPPIAENSPLHWEMRDWLRALPASDRDKLIRNGIERNNLDPLLVQAILAAPVVLSGVSPEMQADLYAREQRAVHGDTAVNELQQLEQGIEIAADANDAAFEEFRFESGDMQRFDSEVSGIKAETKVHWLKNDKSTGVERTIVVDLENRSSHKASEDEIANGRFFKDYDEYVATNGEPVVRQKNIFA